MTDRAVPGTTFDHLSVKGFGDLVIALARTRRLPAAARDRLRFLLGEHLLPLWAALKPPFVRAALARTEQGPATLFAVRRNSPVKVVRSALEVRRALHRARNPAATLLFDEWDVRHRFLSLGVRASTLPRADNLYLRWDAFLAEQEFFGDDLPSTAIPPLSGRSLRIFPGAREVERRLAAPLLRDLVARAERAGLEPRVFTVAGEMPHLADAGLPLEEIPRDFTATMAAVAGADRVISADSMTAHLAEYLGRPVFVLSPTLKRYWLPLSALQAHRHALFGDHPDGTPLPAFLE